MATLARARVLIASLAFSLVGGLADASPCGGNINYELPAGPELGYAILLTGRSLGSTSLAADIVHVKYCEATLTYTRNCRLGPSESECTPGPATCSPSLPFACTPSPTFYRPDDALQLGACTKTPTTVTVTFHVAYHAETTGDDFLYLAMKPAMGSTYPTVCDDRWTTVIATAPAGMECVDRQITIPVADASYRIQVTLLPPWHEPPTPCVDDWPHGLFADGDTENWELSLTSTGGGTYMAMLKDHEGTTRGLVSF